MAGMFYSLKEAAAKLKKTQKELKQIVKDGKLREFRDGPSLLFKVEEVEALMTATGIMGLEEAPEPEIVTPEMPAPEGIPEPEIPAPEAIEPEIPEAEEIPEPEMPAPEAIEPELPVPEAAEPQIPQAEELPEPEIEEEELVSSEQAAGTSEILLAPETGAPVMPGDLTDADTALTGIGTSILGEADQDYEVTDDTMAETALPAGTTGTAPEMPLE